MLDLIKVEYFSQFYKFETVKYFKILLSFFFFFIKCIPFIRFFSDGSKFTENQI